MEKKILKAIIIVGILLVVLFIVLITNYILTNNKQKEEREETFNNLDLEADLELNEIYSLSEFATFNNFINSYFKYIYEKNTQAVLSVLNSDFIDNNNITNINVLNNIDKVEQNQKYYSKKIIELNSSLSIKNYFVYGYFTNNITDNSGNKEVANYIINIDYANNTFSIAPYGKIYQDYIVYKEDTVMKKNNFDVNSLSKQIEKNNYNTINRIDINDKEICEYYLDLYINDALYYREDAYNNLDDEYKIKRFENFNSFNSFVESKKTYFKSAFLNKYLVSQKDKYRQYIVLDNYGNYYIFNETSPMNYTAILDYYTVDIEEFSKKLDTTKTSDKVALNVTKFLDMINYADYKAAYNMLDETFRNNNFGNLNNFINYTKKSFFTINKADLSNFKEQGGVYTIEANIQNYTTYIKESKSNVVSKTFIVKLNEDGTCTMSFNIE